ncbi:phospholipase A2 inhibitor and Ly6/PLAUR domain-containing protein-like isoform X2 [Emydura macquarii macquarii]
MQTCAAGRDSCGIALTESTAVGVMTQTSVKSCATSSECKTGPVSINFGNGITVRMNTACCVGEACRTTTVTVPPANTKPNGWRCPGCFAAFSQQCREETVYCTGAETQCIDITQTVKDGGNSVQSVMKGCASESICTQIKAGSSTIAGITGEITKAECRAASGAGGLAPGAAGLLLPALAGLLLLKLLS